MKQRKPLSPKQLIFACCLLIFFAAIIFFLFSCAHNEDEFERISSRLFRDEMLASTLNMHYTLAQPAAFGIDDYDAVLPQYNAEERLHSREATGNLLSRLYKIDSKDLSKSDAFSHLLLVRSLENAISLNEYAYYEEPLSPASGMQSQLPILLAEYTFRSKRDVEDYLALLDQTDEYFSSLLSFEQEKKNAGLLMCASSLEKVKKQCDTIVSKSALESGTHFLQTTFAERLESLRETGELNEEDMDSFLSQNDRLLKTVVQPAYENLADGLFLLEDSSLPLCGLGAKPQGREYYEYLLRAETGSYLSIPEIKHLLAEAFHREYESIHALQAEHPELLQSLSAHKGESVSDFPLSRPDEMLYDLQERMKTDFPAMPNLSLPNEAPMHPHTLYSSENGEITVTVKPVTPSLEEYSAPAFYLTAPLDDTDNNVIYINKKNSPSGLDLYTTLAHEGYPGHLYQTVYSNRSFLLHDENNVREILWYGGYLEGWALYVEFLSYDYASALLEEQNRHTDALAVQSEKHNRSLQLCLYSLLDVLIHYENASYAQVTQMLEKFGINNPSSVSAVYTYIAEEPCNYPKYYLGYLEILELQKEARALWGDAYSDYAFHKFYLDCGAADFKSLSERLRSTQLSSVINSE